MTTTSTQPRIPVAYAFQDGTPIDPTTLPPIVPENDFTGAWKILMLDRGNGRPEVVRAHYSDGTFTHARIRA